MEKRLFRDMDFKMARRTSCIPLKHVEYSTAQSDLYKAARKAFDARRDAPSDVALLKRLIAEGRPMPEIA
jgi:hypothetical protein